MGTRLNQILAIDKSVRVKGEREMTDAYHAFQKPALLSGLTRTYQPKDEDGEQLPQERTNVQLDVEVVLKAAVPSQVRMFDVVFTKEATNCEAKADVVVDGEVLLQDVPVGYLLFLEKQLLNLRTEMAKLPVLDPAEKWTRDDNAGAWATDVIQTTRTKKTPRSFTKAPATQQHPAQVELYHEDVVVGTWSLTKFSGAVPALRRADLVERVEKLQAAVKYAREAANSIEVTDRQAGQVVFDYLLG